MQALWRGGFVIAVVTTLVALRCTSIGQVRTCGRASSARRLRPFRSGLVFPLLVSLALISLWLSSCGDHEGRGGGPATVSSITATQAPLPSSTPSAAVRPTRLYSLTGTANGQPAQGQLVIAFVMTGPNLLHYDIVSFVFADLNGSGTAELFTLDNTFTVNVAAFSGSGAEAHLAGSAPVLETRPLTFGEFDLAGQGYTLTFSATTDAP